MYSVLLCYFFFSNTLVSDVFMIRQQQSYKNIFRINLFQSVIFMIQMVAEV